MPITPTYPGVYIEEIPSGVRPITGVATAIGAFIDFFPQGQLNKAGRVLSWADFERQYGGLDRRSEASYAVQQFFLNGGTAAYVVRATSSTAGNEAKAAAIVLQDGSGNDILLVTASSEGQWGNNIRIDIDYATNGPTPLFNLTATLVSLTGAKPQVVSSETFRNLSLDKTQASFAETAINKRSQLINVSVESDTALPAQTGAVSAGFADIAIINRQWAASTAFAVSDSIIDPNQNRQTVVAVTGAGNSGANPPSWATTAGTTTTDGDLTWQFTPVPANVLTLHMDGKWQVSLNGNAFANLIDPTTVSVPPTTFAQLAATLQSLIRNVDTHSLGSATVAVVKTTVNGIGGSSTLSYLQIKPGTNDPVDELTFTASTPSTLLTNLKLTHNVQQYALGSSTAKDAQALPGGTGQPGVDGTWDPPNDAGGMTGGLIGDADAKTGMYALLDVDLFNILCIPVTTLLPDSDAAQVATKATDLCTQRRAFYILDPPQQDGDRDKVTDIMNWLDQNATLRSRNAAIYFPRPDIADPLNNFQQRKTAPSGTMAGVYSRTDVARGVWKAPAGTEATLAGVQALEYRLTDNENGVLNPLAINCLRTFPIYGNVAWGARTLNGADQLADEYKYVPVRRLALFLEESLYRGLQWVVFQPNDEPLWAQIRLNATAFMQSLFRQGAFQGSTPQQAYFVKCDNDTTTSTDQDLGIVNIVVGFAPLKPAEFVIIKIQQIAAPLTA